MTISVERVWTVNSDTYTITEFGLGIQITDRETETTFTVEAKDIEELSNVLLAYLERNRDAEVDV